MKKELTIALLAVGMTIGMASMVTASEETTDVEVDVSGVTQLDVRPSALEYTDAGEEGALEPGDARTVSDLGYEHIEVENIGSERIGSIYAQGTMHTEQPFGTDADEETPSLHNTGNFVTISLETAQDGNYRINDYLSSVDTMHHLNRVEYFEENPPTYINAYENGDDAVINDEDGTEVINDEVTSVDVGRFKVGGAEYFFVFYTFDTAEDHILIGNAPHTSTVLGSTDFTEDGEGDYSVDEASTDLAGDLTRVTGQDFVTFDTSESGNYDGSNLLEGGNALDESGEAADPAELEGAETRSYNLYIDPVDEYAARTKFNVEFENPDGSEQVSEETSGAQEFILQATEDNENEALQPGENFPINFGVQIPLGVDQNAIEEGTVTVISETYTAP